MLFSCPLDPQEGCLYVFIIQQFLTCSMKYYLSGFQDICTVGYRKGLLDVLLNYQDRRSLIPYPFYDVKYLPHKNRRQTK